MFNVNITFKDLKDNHNKELFKLQQEHLTLALHHALQTQIGKFIYHENQGKAKGMWNKICNHYSSTKSSQMQSKKVLDKLQNLNVTEYSSLIKYSTQFDKDYQPI